MIIKQNPDKAYAQRVKDKLRENNGYCPCRLEKTEDTKCMCKVFRDADEGMCHCGLYIKEKD